MDAKTFISTKHAAAVEELRAIEAEYLPRINAAKSMIDLTKKMLDELAMEKGNAEPVMPRQEAIKPLVEEKPVVESVISLQEPTTVEEEVNEPEAVIVKPATPKPSENWISARDLLPKVRQAS